MTVSNKNNDTSQLGGPDWASEIRPYRRPVDTLRRFSLDDLQPPRGPLGGEQLSGIDDLKTETTLGGAALFNFLRHPPTEIDEGLMLWSAMSELMNDPEKMGSLRDALRSNSEEFLNGYSVEETALGVMAPDFKGRPRPGPGLLERLRNFGRWVLNREGRAADEVSAVGELLRNIEQFSNPESDLLSELIGKVQDALEDRDGEFLEGVAIFPHYSYVIVTTHPSEDQTPPWLPVFMVHRGPINFEHLSLPLGLSILVGFELLKPTVGDLAPLLDAIRISLLIGLLPAGYRPLNLGSAFKETVANSEPLVDALNAIGELDLVLALATLAQSRQQSQESASSDPIDLNTLCITVGAGTVAISSAPSRVVLPKKGIEMLAQIQRIAPSALATLAQSRQQSQESASSDPTDLDTLCITVGAGSELYLRRGNDNT
jgi:hypothetical protein